MPSYKKVNGNYTIETTGASDAVTLTTSKVSLSGVLQLGSFTTTQRNALSPSAGWVIYNSTTSKVQVYTGSTWSDLN